ncbi:hypothetical protein CEE37_10480 [candidate division LCP-89 bacterium B3_LCP]|uniref:Uncharacterized protein n=1 Tax=candidate division LCP-89 bacterium B3_LCP TaxID=2012998 RepID=A0A532UY66_UNCL8|nr:MAG: hypothetical protein CEE37_10480 [candidate division LCP-89 bacterium B3_LCP]
MHKLAFCMSQNDFPAVIPHPFFLQESSPIVLCGPTDLLKKSRFTILNSRQSPRMNKHDEWIANTLNSLRSEDLRNNVLVTSLGTTSWDFLTWAGNRIGLPIILIFPPGSAQNFNVLRTKAIIGLGLEDAKTLAIRPLVIRRSMKHTETNALRDNWVFALSQRLIKNSIRPGGNFERYLSHEELPETDISRELEVQYKKSPPNRRPKLPERIALPEWYKPEEYLIHWTRSCVGPWPDEKRCEHFGRMMESKPSDNQGMETLMRIFSEKVIRASTRMIRGGYAVVPFTARPPEDLSKLIRWRVGLRRWTFEPYGIAIKRSRLEALGARPALYGDIAKYDSLSEGDRSFFQMAGSGKQDWTKEREWRVHGNIELNKLDKNDITAIVHIGEEAAEIGKKHKIPALSIT